MYICFSGEHDNYLFVIRMDSSTITLKSNCCALHIRTHMQGPWRSLNLVNPAWSTLKCTFSVENRTELETRSLLWHAVVRLDGDEMWITTRIFFRIPFIPQYLSPQKHIYHCPFSVLLRFIWPYRQFTHCPVEPKKSYFRHLNIEQTTWTRLPNMLTFISSCTVTAGSFSF